MPNLTPFVTRRFTRREVLITGAAAAASVLLPSFALAQPAPKENVDYTLVTPPQTTEHPGKIEVTEFFGFWCPHCNEFDPILSAWAKKLPGDVVMRYIPIAFYDNQVPLQRLFYTLQVLGLDLTLRGKVFDAIHLTHTPLDTGEQQASWAAQNGIDKKKYLDLYNSFSVQSSARRATSIANAYAISSVPTLGVNGKYLVLGGPSTLGTVDYLIGTERHK